MARVLAGVFRCKSGRLGLRLDKHLWCSSLTRPFLKETHRSSFEDTLEYLSILNSSPVASRSRIIKAFALKMKGGKYAVGFTAITVIIGDVSMSVT